MKSRFCFHIWLGFHHWGWNSRDEESHANGQMKLSDLRFLEHQIPPSLFRNVLKLTFIPRRDTTSSLPNLEDGEVSNPHYILNIDEAEADDTEMRRLVKAVKVAIANILSQVSGDCSNSKVMLVRKDKVNFHDCEHLLECLIGRQGVDKRCSTSQIPCLHSSNSLTSWIAQLLKASISKEDLSILPQHKPKVHPPPVSDLKKAGVNVVGVGDKVRGCTLKFMRLLDFICRQLFRFTTTLLLHIEDSTESILRNLVALESPWSSGTARDQQQHVLMSYLQCMNYLVEHGGRCPASDDGLQLRQSLPFCKMASQIFYRSIEPRSHQESSCWSVPLYLRSSHTLTETATLQAHIWQFKPADWYKEEQALRHWFLVCLYHQQQQWIWTHLRWTMGMSLNSHGPLRRSLKQRRKKQPAIIQIYDILDLA